MNNHVPVLTGAQLRAARALLDFSCEDLAKACKVTTATIYKIERGGRPYRRTEASIVKALEKRGVIFWPSTDADHSGVSLRKTK